MKNLIAALTVLCLISTKCHARHIYEADYIVVGMGAAGAEVAKLLSDDRRMSVIGIEAGGNHDDDIPIKDSTYAPVLEDDYSPQYFYQIEQKKQGALPDIQFNYTTGRMLGGGSSINGMQYVEGTNELYRKWEKLLGKFWSIEEIRCAFKEIERFKTKNKSYCRGSKGELNIRLAPEMPTSMAEKFSVAVSHATGFPEIFDYNNPQTELGPFTRWQLTQKRNGNRESSSTAFLAPYLKKQQTRKRGRKLKILDKTTVTKVLFKGNKARGVRILQNGTPGTVYARKKIILCAGVLSPCILQLSGIGPRDVLEKAGVKVLYENSNVGKDLVNQFICTAMLSANPSDVGVPENDLNALYVGGAFLPDPSLPYDSNNSRGLRGIQLIGMSPEPGVFLIAVINLQPVSRGVVNIQSADPFQVPLVDDGAFENQEDLQTFVDAFRIYIKSIAKELNAIDSMYNLISPSTSVIDDTNLLTEYIKANIGHTHHWTGTCKMGKSAYDGVVDKHGNVFGVENLVVADDSIAPFIPDGNTQACAYLIGRKIAKHIVQTQHK